MASSRRPANWKRPSDLTREEAVAYDVASALVSGGVLPEVTYRQSIAAFGEEGTAEFINLVGLYCMVSVTLNGFDVRPSLFYLRERRYDRSSQRNRQYGGGGGAR